MSERAVIEWRCENGEIVGRVTEAGVIDERHKAEAVALHFAAVSWQMTHSSLVLIDPAVSPGVTVRLRGV